MTQWKIIILAITVIIMICIINYFFKKGEKSEHFYQVSTSPNPVLNPIMVNNTNTNIEINSKYSATYNVYGFLPTANTPLELFKESNYQNLYGPEYLNDTYININSTTGRISLNPLLRYYIYAMFNKKITTMAGGSVFNLMIDSYDSNDSIIQEQSFSNSGIYNNYASSTNLTINLFCCIQNVAYIVPKMSHSNAITSFPTYPDSQAYIFIKT
jgi:hypothetical protein